MGLIDTTIKSLRFLLGRRYTSGDLNTSQEAYTSVLDIRSSEIYTQDNLIPTSSLPFSGSSQNGSIYYVGEESILRYWYRHPLTKSNLDTDVWFFLAPVGSVSGVTPQIIQNSQQTNFISPKYAVPTLANQTSEDNPPGYGIIVYKSTTTDTGSLAPGDIVSPNDYQFDYKTGVLQFDANQPTASQRVYISVNQYIGKTLSTGLKTSGPLEGSQLITTGSLNVSGSFFLNDTNILDEIYFSGIFRQTGSFFSTTNDLVITGSLDVELDGSEDTFSVNIQGDSKLKVNEEGVLVLSFFENTPNPVDGGLFFSSSREFFVGL